MPEVISGKVTGGVTVVKHIHLAEVLDDDNMFAGGYTNEMSGTIKTQMEPWLGLFNVQRTTSESVMIWGKRVTGLASDA